jgi:hypothetical protein
VIDGHGIPKVRAPDVRVIRDARPICTGHTADQSAASLRILISGQKSFVAIAMMPASAWRTVTVMDDLSDGA